MVETRRPSRPASGLAAQLSRVRRLAPFLRPAADRIAYVGPGNSANLGDRAMYVAYGQLLTPHPVVTVPAKETGSGLWLADSLTRNRSLGAIALGGGTLIGSRQYRRQLKGLTDRFREVPTFALGTGVEDPEFDVKPMTNHDELSEWRDLLEGATVLTVRGPRSRQILLEHGIDAEMTGDPALMLGDTRPTDEYTSRHIGINVGWTGPLWGGSVDAVVGKLVEFGSVLASRGWTVELLPVWPPDVPYCLDVASRISGATAPTSVPSLSEALATVRGCDVFVGLKLHSVVLASTVFTPSVMIEYRPKCRDFQQSIGRGEFTVRTDDISVDTLVAMVDQLSSNRADHVEHLYRSVAQRRQAIRDAARAVKVSLTDAV